MKSVFHFVGIAWAGLTTLVVIDDMMDFHFAVSGSYKTPWYNAGAKGWMTEPYTNLRLLGNPSKEYWTENAIKSERWFVREVQFEDKTFWTILQRVPY